MNLKEEKKIMFLKGELNPHPLWSGNWQNAPLCTVKQSGYIYSVCKRPSSL